MPQRGKSRRAAARQTQLGQKKRRHARGPSEVPATVEPSLVSRTEEPRVSPPQTRINTPAPETVVAPRPQIGRPPEQRPAAYAYVRSEIKRIAGLSAGAIAILIALSFVLR